VGSDRALVISLAVGGVLAVATTFAATRIYDSVADDSGVEALDRPALARAAFENNRIDELNRVIHPAVIAEEEHLLAELGRSDPHAVGVVESALIFEASKAGTDLGFVTNLSITPAWLDRFDKIILVTAPENLRVQRFVDRMLQLGPPRPDAATLASADARRRMSHQLPDADKIPFADYVISNEGSLDQLQSQVTRIYSELQSLA
jgi:dephospho-CoA kinase